MRLWLSLVLLGQFTGAQTAQTSTFSAKTTLVTVPVVVRDANGKPIGTLTKENFQLFDRGRQQTITRFSIEKSNVLAPASGSKSGELRPRSERPGTGLPERYVAYLFDDVHLEPAELMQARDAAWKHLQEHVDPDARAAVYTTSARVSQEFTDDREKLHKALLRMMSQTEALVAHSECPQLTFYEADLIIHKNNAEALRTATIETLECLVQGMDEEAARRLSEQVARSTAMRVLQQSEMDTLRTLRTAGTVAKRMSVMPGVRTILMVSPGFLLGDRRREETDLIDRAVRAGVVINTLDARGLYTTIPGGDASHGGGYRNFTVQMDKEHYRRMNASASADVMGELAEATGGIFFESSNDLKDGFRRLAARPEYMYVLGFMPQDLKNDGSYHSLKVSLTNARGKAQARRGYFELKGAVDSKDEEAEEIRTELFLREEFTTIPLDISVELKMKSIERKLVVTASIDAHTLKFRKVGGRNTNRVTMVAGVFDNNGNYIEGTIKTADLKLLDPTLETMLSARMGMQFSFGAANPGKFTVRVVVRDIDGQSSLRTAAIEIP